MRQLPGPIIEELSTRVPSRLEHQAIRKRKAWHPTELVKDVRTVGDLDKTTPLGMAHGVQEERLHGSRSV